MFTPQQIDQISFGKATFGGYNMDDVDAFLEPLTEDYITLYKENALLKSKMKVLVNKLEEYRNNEASMKDAIVNAQKTCDLMVKEAEAKCTQMLNDANAAAAENARNADAMIKAENARVEEARQVAAQKIASLQEQLNACVEALEYIKTANRPVRVSAEESENKAAESVTDAVADEISANLEAMIGTADEALPAIEHIQPASGASTGGKFANLQFGRNYDPTNR